MARLVHRARGRTEGGTDYGKWVDDFDALDADTANTLATWSRAPIDRPTLSILVVLGSAPLSALDQTLDSLRRQLYPHWQLCAVLVGAGEAQARAVTLTDSTDSRLRASIAQHDATALSEALALASGEFIGVLDAGDRLPAHGLAMMAEEIVGHPEASLVYSDEDVLGDDGARRAPRFKPDFNLDFLRSLPYVGRLTLMRRNCLLAAGGFDPAAAPASEYDATLRVVERLTPAEVRHVPRVLCHRASAVVALDASAQMSALSNHFARLTIGATSEPMPAVHGAMRVRYRVPTPAPLVTIVIPTKNQQALLATCLNSIRERTDYPAYEIVVVDNGSDEPSARAYLATLASVSTVRITRDDRPFNWAALNNRAVDDGAGDVLCFVNNDVEVMTPEWLTELVGYAMRSDVGAVGARLWYPDDTLQHAGLAVHPAAGAIHLHQRLSRGAPGYLGRAVVAHNVSAVTGACLAVRQRVFREAGGFDEAFAVDFNDVDFCLRLLTLGYRNVWTPFAELIHHEAATRGPFEQTGNRRRFEQARRLFLERWHSVAMHDPAFNPNLSHAATPLPLAWPPRIAPLSS